MPDKPAGGGVMDRALRHVSRDFVAQMALAMAFWPGLVAWLVVPNFPARYAARPALAALMLEGRPWFVLLSVASLAAWWLLNRHRRSAALAALWVADAAFCVLQIWGVYPGAGP